MFSSRRLSRRKTELPHTTSGDEATKSETEAEIHKRDQELHKTNLLKGFSLKMRSWGRSRNKVLDFEAETTQRTGSFLPTKLSDSVKDDNNHKIERSDESTPSHDDENVEDPILQTLTDCVVHLEDAIKEERLWNKNVKKREVELIRALEVVATKVKELSRELPQVPFQRKTHYEQQLGKYQIRMSLAKDSLKKSRTTNGGFANALLDRAEEAERKEKEARSIIQQLEEQLSALTNGSGMYHPSRKDSSGEITNSALEAKVRELTEQLEISQEMNKRLSRMISEKENSTDWESTVTATKDSYSFGKRRPVRSSVETDSEQQEDGDSRQNSGSSLRRTNAESPKDKQRS